MALPSLGRNIKAQAAWSVSYAEANRLSELQKKVETKSNSVYELGDPRSEDFFRRMEASIAETERLRRHCKRAAAESVSRNQEERVCLENTNRSIESARAMAETARSAARPIALAELRSGAESSLPAALGHLQVPRPALEEQEAPPSPSSRQLPGQLEEERQGPRPVWSLHAPAPSSPPPPAEVVPPLQLEEAAPRNCSLPLTSERARPKSSSRPATSEQSQAKNASRPSTSRNSTEDLAAGKEKRAGRSSPGSSASSDFASDALEEEESSSGGWPPRPPLLRFKMRLQFSNRFQGGDKALFQEVNEGISKQLFETERKEMKDMTIGWFNMFFEFAIATEFEFEIGFPIIILTMLDAIYPKRVRWREVDWRLQYKVAIKNNYVVVNTIWDEVNMEKAREFRYSALHMEDMAMADLRAKLSFLKLMKHWFDNRIHSAPEYDPMAKRRQFVEQCRLWGHRIKFPAWIRYDKEAVAPSSPRRTVVPASSDFDEKPEFERLIHFLGSTDVQTM